MQTANVRRFIFSSSCTVYGSPEHVPVAEDARLQVTSPYGRTKLAVEEILGDLAHADASFRFASLRYFNPVGAHPSGQIGEDPRGIPNNLMPLVCQVANGKRAKLHVYGSDWPTVDGSGMRDYLHVVDLAQAHVAALDYLVREDRSLTVNLGTGQGSTVLQVIRAFEQATGQKIAYEVVGRRDGDADPLWADPSLAQKVLHWRAKYDLATMCRDAWHWHSTNPDGYDG
jgi:UDP-glucose 4-epimerase